MLVESSPRPASSGASPRVLNRQRAQELNDEAAVFVLQDAHVSCRHRRHIAADELQPGDALIDFRHHVSRSALNGWVIKGTMIARDGALVHPMFGAK